MKRVAFHNLGCKVNSYEMEAMQQNLEEKGYHIVPFDEIADIYIVNTCTVTNIADRKSRQMLHRAKQLNPAAIVVAVGCYVQAGREKVEQDDSIDLAIGNNRKKDIAPILEEYLQQRQIREQDAAGQAELERQEAERKTKTELERQEEAERKAKTELERQEEAERKAKTELERQEEAERKAKTELERQEEPEKKAKTELERQEEPEKKTEAAERKAETNRQTEQGKAKQAVMIDINGNCEYEEMQLKHTGERTRACIKIQDGCNQFCSYCVIPYARGRVRSRRAEDIIREIEGLVKEGCREVVLTGIHISSYGIDFDEEAWKMGVSRKLLHGEQPQYTGSSKLIDLIERIHDIEGLERIRLGSLEPRIIQEEAARRFSAMSKLCPHFHLSLQSGCDTTLKRMNRHYTTREYYTSVEILRKFFDHPAVTTDVIVGFPGETEEEFALTKEFLEKVCFYEMHIFKYSRREGTRAASMRCQVPEPVKAQRSSVLLALAAEQSTEFRKRYIGREAEVLPEETREINGRRYQIGHTKDYVKVAIESRVQEEAKLAANTVVRVRVTGFLTDEILLAGETMDS